MGSNQTKGGTVIKDKSEKLNRWIEQYSELYTGQSNVTANKIASLSNTPTINELDSESDLEEVTTAINRLPKEWLPVKM